MEDVGTEISTKANLTSAIKHYSHCALLSDQPAQHDMLTSGDAGLQASSVVELFLDVADSGFQDGQEYEAVLHAAIYSLNSSSFMSQTARAIGYQTPTTMYENRIKAIYFQIPFT